MYGKYYTFNRTFVADMASVEYELSFTEIEHDSVLAFSFKRKGDSKTISPLFVYNSAWDVVSFVFTKDTIYIRDEKEFYDLFPPEERYKYPVLPKDFKKYKIIKGDVPSSCKLIPYSDSRFFLYDRKTRKYILKDTTMHIIHLNHYIERANDYHLFDESRKDTLEIYLNECAKQ